MLIILSTCLDHDPIIYNSQFQLNLVPLGGDQTVHQHFSVHKNGSLNIQTSMADLDIYKPVDFKVVAYDFGSPQLFSVARISVIPVSVSGESVHLDSSEATSLMYF